MAKRQRVIHTRGNAAETPNWRFSLSTSIARKDVPELCQGLAFIVGERKGGSYYYPDYVDGKTAAAFEWYRPYRRRIFGYKIGVEFWIEETNLEKLGVYVLYGEDLSPSNTSSILTTWILREDTLQSLLSPSNTSSKTK